VVKKTPKSVSQEDLEVWKKITIQLKRNKPEVLIKKNISGLKIKKSSKSLPKAPELKPFIIGEKVLKKEKIILPNFHEDNKINSPNMDKKNFKKLVKGKMEIEGTIDLHGLTADQAKIKLITFINHSYSLGKRLIIVITGKGKHKGFDEFQRPINGVLRQNLPEWLSGPSVSNKVLQVTQAQPKHGGAGAFYVYLRRQR
jgi:DNA-nicking Smr family endonuclease|tara:strand:+ start:2976 stop:3572 length:597 start_codon:yes stop_codon:yes gene_type:complete